MAEEKTQVRKPFKGAKVDWPADMPDDMLEDAITVAKNALDSHDFEEQGVEVSTAFFCAQSRDANCSICRFYRLHKS